MLSHNKQSRYGGRRDVLRRLASVAAILTQSRCGQPTLIQQLAKGAVRVSNLVISPDNRIIVFQVDIGGQRPALGTFDSYTQTLDRLTYSSQLAFRAPRFLPDSTRCVAIANGQFPVIVDPTRKTVDRLPFNASPGAFWIGVTIQPETSNLLLVESRTFDGIRLRILNQTNGQSSLISAEHNRFVLQMSVPCFIESDVVIFQALAPMSQAIKERVCQLALVGTHNIAYRLKFGEKPTILYPNLEKTLRRHDYDDGFLSLTASKNGKTVLAISLSSSLPEDSLGRYNDEVYNIADGGRAHAITNIKSHLEYLTVSYDGKLACFISDVNRVGNSRSVRLM